MRQILVLDVFFAVKVLILIEIRQVEIFIFAIRERTRRGLEVISANGGVISGVLFGTILHVVR